MGLDLLNFLDAAFNPQKVSALNPLPVTTISSSTGALTVERLISAANSTNAKLVKNASGKIYQIRVFNGATASWLKIYNKASAPTVGTDTPFDTIFLPVNTLCIFDYPGGLTLSTGIGYAITLNGADADNTAVAAGATSGLGIAYA